MDSELFFYVLYPDMEFSIETEEWLSSQIKPVSGRMQIIKYSTKIRDRMEEHYKFSTELYRLMCPDTNNGLWDAEVVITSRITQIPMFKTASGRVVGFDGGSYRAVIGLDEMPIFPFRKTVSWGSHMALTSMNCYLMSDGIVVNNLWTKNRVLQEARLHLSPINTKKILTKIYETVPVELQTLKIKKTVKPLTDVCNVLFCGRMTGTRNFKGVLALFRKQFSYTVGRNIEVKFKVSTQSLSTGGAAITDDKFLEYVLNNREGFYKMLEQEAHVVVNLSTVEDFSLSTYEPLLYGVPVIVSDKDWTNFLGDSYPYRASTEIEAYSMIKSAITNYPAFYKRFADWHKTYWVDFVKSMQGNSTTTQVYALLQEHKKKLHDNFHYKDLGGSYKAMVQTMLVRKPKKVDIIAELKKQGVYYHVDLNKVPIAKLPSVITIKFLLRKAGYEDTNETGVMIRVRK
jgi:hypothetical protein